MNKSIIFIFCILALLSCNSNKAENKKIFETMIAKQITIDKLNEELQALAENKTEFNFIGITSNGVDCIYFTKNGQNFNIEFEAMSMDQFPYIEKLKSYASKHAIRTKIHSYGNYMNDKPKTQAPVIQIETQTNILKTIEIATQIQTIIFKNNKETKYEVVP